MPGHRLNGNTITNAGSAVATVSAAGTYVLTVTTASGGCAARDTMVVTNNTSAPNANAGADQPSPAVPPTLPHRLFDYRRRELFLERAPYRIQW